MNKCPVVDCNPNYFQLTLKAEPKAISIKVSKHFMMADEVLLRNLGIEIFWTEI